MPHIVVKMYPGRDETIKENFCEKLIELTMDALKVPDKAVTVMIEEIPKELWETQVREPEINKNEENVFVKHDGNLCTLKSVHESEADK